MKKIINILLIVGAFALLYNCNDDHLPQPESAKVTVGYINELQGKNTLRFTVSDNGGQMDITPRISRLSEGDASFTIEVDSTVLEDYNTKNGTKYKMLPNSVFNLVDKKTGAEGKILKFNLKKGEYGADVEVKVSAMVDKQGEKLPLSTSYAIPVRLKNIKADNYVDTQSARQGVILLDRRFTTTVLNIDGRIGAQLKEGVGQYNECTIQYSFKPKSIRENFGLMYPDNDGNRERGTSTFYATLYGGGVTLFTPSGGKVQFNQSNFKDYKFEANKWYHITMVIKDNNLSFYVNGELAYKSFWGELTDWTGLYLGNSVFNAYVREIRLWNRALSDSEINSTLYFADPSAEGLQVYLPLNKENGLNNIAKGKEDKYNIVLDSGASKENINFDTEVTFP